MVKGSSSITENLMSVSRMMASEVARSQHTVSTLGQRATPQTTHAQILMDAFWCILKCLSESS